MDVFITQMSLCAFVCRKNEDTYVLKEYILDHVGANHYLVLPMLIIHVFLVKIVKHVLFKLNVLGYLVNHFVLQAGKWYVCLGS